MNIQISNCSKSILELGGFVINPSNSTNIHSSLITKSELSDLRKDFNIVKKSDKLLIFKDLIKKTVVPKKIPKIEEITINNTEDTNTNIDILEVFAYPKELIKSDGTLNGSIAKKAQIKEIEELDIIILNDNDFKEKYPDLDIEKHRFER